MARPTSISGRNSCRLCQGINACYPSCPTVHSHDFQLESWRDEGDQVIETWRCQNQGCPMGTDVRRKPK